MHNANHHKEHRSLRNISVILLLLLGFAATPALAQKTWSLGPEAGLSLAQYRLDGSDHDLKTGLVAGAHLTHSTLNTFGITLKALYHQKGTRFEQNNVEYKERLNYLELPLVGRFFLTSEGNFRPNLFVGPSFGFLLGGKDKNGDDDFEKFSDAKRDNYNSFDFGLTGGLGLNYLIMNETRLLFDIRYNHGLSNINDTNTTSFYNQGLAFTFGLSFGLQ